MEHSVLQQLCQDIMFANEIPFLISISRKLGLLNVAVLESRTATSVAPAIDQIIAKYKEQGFTVM